MLATGRSLVWLQAARLPIYPLAFVAFSLGALAARSAGHTFSLVAFATGYACMFLLELYAVLCNDLCDLKTDRLNRNFSLFNGGSRVLVEGRLTERDITRALSLTAGLLALAALLLYAILPRTHALPAMFLLGGGLTVSLGYSAPPLKFAYRGLGEILVGLMHGPYVLLCGYLFLGGSLSATLPWLLSVPIFFAVVCAILLAGIPDRTADEAAGKYTLAVQAGAVRIAAVALVAAMLAVFTAALVWTHVLGSRWLALFVAAAAGHMICLSIALVRFIRSGAHDGRINGLLLMAVAYIHWFCLVPLGALF